MATLSLYRVSGGVVTKTALHGLPEHMLGVLTDTAELPAGFCVWLSAPAKYADTDFFKGRCVKLTDRPYILWFTEGHYRYLSCLWDVDDMVKRGKQVAGTEAAEDWLLMPLVV